MLLIRGGRVIDPVREVDEIMDVKIEGSKIVETGKALKVPADAEVIDATGLVVAPGLMDAHVHFRDPGLTYKEDIETGAAAAARGGFTTVVCMANTKPVVDNLETLSYVNGKNDLYLMVDGNIWHIGLEDKSSEIVVSGISTAGCRVAENDSMLVWQKDLKDYGSTLEFMNLNSGKLTETQGGRRQFYSGARLYGGRPDLRNCVCRAGAGGCGRQSAVPDASDQDPGF